MKILVIGASGMLAKPVVNHLDKNGFELKLFSRTVNSSMFEKNYEMVQGDVFNPSDLNNAMSGCDAVHISLAKIDEAEAAKAIVAAAKQNKIEAISMISGSSVCEENRWFNIINKKYLAEQELINSGIPYMIFRPSWFFESLGLMIRNGKATMIGKKPQPFHWLAADDYARMLSNAYQKPEARNKIFVVLGPQLFTMTELLERYIRIFHPEIKKVSSAPITLLRLIARLSGNKELKEVVALFAYFEKTKESVNVEETNALLGKPEINFEKWVDTKKAMEK